MQQSIICGVDGSQASRSAANVAAAVADTLGHELALVHVARCAATFPDHDAGLREYQRRSAIQRGERLLETVAHGLPRDAPETLVALGTPARTLKAWSRLDEVALLVVGSRRYRSTWRAPAVAAPLPAVVVSPSVRPAVREWTPLAAAPGCITRRASARRGRALQDPS